jgi:glycyl-tRNA synthetase beta chain
MEKRTDDLLVEIGTEELPPTALRGLSEAFTEGFRRQLEQHRLGFTAVESFATPRRLAIVASGVTLRQPDQVVVRKGPAVANAFDVNGHPTQAALGFARSCGVGVSDLQREESAKGAWLVVTQTQEGLSTRELAVPMLDQVLRALPIAKRMRWGDGEDEFVRPVHWVTVIVGEEAVRGRLFGVDVGRSTRGHRFHHPEEIVIRHAGDYVTALTSIGRVQPSFERRREMITSQVTALATAVSGSARLDDDLLDETTALCEWPVAILGSFDEEFLEVPPEVLVETMQKNQKFFPVFSVHGQLMPHFITISNIESLDPGQVRAGNERVIRPRFADAAFFWRQDLRHPLETFAKRLEKVVFQERLGTLAEKSSRVAQLCRYVAGAIGVDEELAARSAYLAKCDLATQMIFEFPTLQGIIGRYYAERSGEDPCVAAAMEEQYLPRLAGGPLPATDCGRVLSLADKLDTLVGIFAIGERPTGVKDPYALRRAAIGVLRILIETPLDLDLRELLKFAAAELRTKVDARAAAGEVFEYAMERLKGYFHDRGIGGDVVEAVVAREVSVPSDIHRRILAVQTFRTLPEAQSLTAANKRIRNILRKADEDVPTVVDRDSLEEVEEQQLFARVRQLEEECKPLIEQQDYEGVLRIASALRADVDSFFDRVLVMAEDGRIRRNRLALLQFLEGLFLRVADISKLQ